MSTDLEEPEVETEMIVLSKDKSGDNDALIARLTNDWLPLKCNGADDMATFKIVDDARKRMVKFRTGMNAQVKELVAPHKAEIDRIKAQAERYQSKLSVVEEHLKGEVDSVKAELERREQEKADELYDLRKRRWLEATGNPPDFDGAFPEAFLRGMTESEFEAEIQRLTEKTRKDREETIKRIEAEAEATRLRNEEAKRLKEAADKLAADQAAFAQQQREAKAKSDLLEQQQREAQERIDAETRRLASERRQNEEADKPVEVVPVGWLPPPEVPSAAPAEDGPPPYAPAAWGSSPSFVPPASTKPDDASYDKGYTDGMRHLWKSIGHKFPESALAAQIANRKASDDYQPARE